jgi:hypothetical protein
MMSELTKNDEAAYQEMQITFDGRDECDEVVLLRLLARRGETIAALAATLDAAREREKAAVQDRDRLAGELAEAKRLTGNHGWVVCYHCRGSVFDEVVDRHVYKCPAHPMRGVEYERDAALNAAAREVAIAAIEVVGLNSQLGVAQISGDRARIRQFENELEAAMTRLDIVTRNNAEHLGGL